MFAYLLDSFQQKQEKIHFLLHRQLYIRGAVLHAETLSDLKLSGRVFDYSVAELNYFAARMAYFSLRFDQSLERYPSYDARRGAFAELDRFDESNNRYRQQVFDPQTGRLQRVITNDPIFAELLDLGLNVSQFPVAGLHFNNGYLFKKDKYWNTDSQIAKQINDESPGETWLSIGDPSTHHFFPIFVLGTDGRILRVQEATDFLSIRKSWFDPSQFQYEFVVRELKLTSPNADVDVIKSLRQVTSTVQNLRSLYPGIGIGTVELVVPQRGLSLGHGFRRSDDPVVPGTNVFKLIKGREWYDILVGDTPLHVNVRLVTAPQ